ncbi:MAG: DUF4416 family protein [Phycisphaerae bacterium]|nr:DUF4416 family protein [Phycisphaerae bacterium]
MARPRGAKPVKLFVGMLSSDHDLLRRARHLLTREYGEIDLESDFWRFDQTDYYEPEMGPDLQRWFISFTRLIRPDHLPQIKRLACEMEERIAGEALSEIPRPVNLDPGYLDLNKLVLGTTKDASHRIYVGNGIFAEVTLRYTQGGWQLLPWTYPDFRQSDYHVFFEKVRAAFREQRREFLNRHALEGEASE